MKTPFKAGMYLLETLTSGMYNDPLSIYREYIQNSVDSIDQSDRPPKEAEIKIELNPFQKSVTIYDNGDGIPTKTAESTLSSIGSSGKFGTQQRGFRGIGRLGGIAFAKKVIFRTTAIGESVISTQEWDCENLRKLLRTPEHSSMTIEGLFSRVSIFSQQKDTSIKKVSFFEVQLLDVESFRDYIFDIQRIKKYLVQVAPLPFDPKRFSFHEEVQRFLTENVPMYGEYKITLNDEQLFRPYSDELSITSKQRNDQIEAVKLFTLKYNGTALAYGWYGKRRDFLGSIRKGAAVSGLRVKVGNLQVGDQHLLDHCFRENRFNSYTVGEIHVCDQSLLPNSRRDDFVDNKEKAVLFNLIEREIGLPLSKEIRRQSRAQAKRKAFKQEKKSTATTKKSALSEKQSSPVPITPESVSQELSENGSASLLEQLLSQCSSCKTLQSILEEHLN